MPSAAKPARIAAVVDELIRSLYTAAVENQATEPSLCPCLSPRPQPTPFPAGLDGRRRVVLERRAPVRRRRTLIPPSGSWASRSASRPTCWSTATTSWPGRCSIAGAANPRWREAPLEPAENDRWRAVFLPDVVGTLGVRGHRLGRRLRDLGARFAPQAGRQPGRRAGAGGRRRAVLVGRLARARRGRRSSGQHRRACCARPATCGAGPAQRWPRTPRR